jgi:hypothetical protein
MDMAGEWYTSGTFWAAAGFVAVVVFGALTIIVTYLVSTAHRELNYSIITNVPLLGRVAKAARQDLKVIYRGDHVPNPRIVTIRLAARGRKDIRSNEFDQGKPLIFDLGVPIINVVSSSAEAQEVTNAHGTTIEFGPSLIRKRRVLLFNVLVDDVVQSVTCRNPLIDIPVEEKNEFDLSKIGIVMAVAFSATYFAGLLAGIFVIFAKSGHHIAIPLAITLYIGLLVIEGATGYFAGRTMGLVSGRMKKLIQ